MRDGLCSNKNTNMTFYYHIILTTTVTSSITNDNTNHGYIKKRGLSVFQDLARQKCRTTHRCYQLLFKHCLFVTTGSKFDLAIQQ